MNRSKKLYTTHQVAKLLGVTPITVIRWIEGGKFKCYTTVGGHRRIEHDELIQFARTYHLPWQGETEIHNKKEFILLAVDDQPELLNLLKDILEPVKDVRLIAVTNAFTAGARLVEERPDLILLDFLMPELDGFEFCRFLRNDPRFKDIPVIAMTGLKTQEDQAKMLKVGVNEFLLKPFNSDLLIEKISHYKDNPPREEPQSSTA